VVSEGPGQEGVTSQPSPSPDQQIDEVVLPAEPVGITPLSSGEYIQAETSSQSEKKGSSINPLNLGILIALVVIVVLMVYFIFLTGDPSDDDGNKLDLDSDGMPNDYEEQYGLQPEVDDANLDLDNDGLTNFEEYTTGTIPNDDDTDDDGYLDGDDVDPFKDVSITLEITWVRFLDNIDAGLFSDNMNGDPYFIVTISGVEFKTDEPITRDKSSTSLNETFTYNIPDNKETCIITIQLWDDDESDDDLCDICPGEARDLTLEFDIATGLWSGDVYSGSASGEGDGSDDWDDDDASISFDIYT
jgi:hypothetical protein